MRAFRIVKKPPTQGDSEKEKLERLRAINDFLKTHEIKRLPPGCAHFY